MNALDLFSPNWIIFGLGEIRPSEGTYCSTDYTSLPPVEIPPYFQWLTSMHPEVAEEMEDYRKTEEHNKSYLTTRAAILKQAEEKGIHLPSPFIKLTGDIELQNRIPSCTACYFDLPSSITESPFRENDHIIRFLNDQQCCICWYLYIPHDAPAFVISSHGNENEPFLDLIQWDNNQTKEQALQNCAIVAKDFEEFIYRFWIENTIWFHTEFDLELSTTQKNYILHISPNYFN